MDEKKKEVDTMEQYYRNVSNKPDSTKPKGKSELANLIYHSVDIIPAISDDQNMNLMVNSEYAKAVTVNSRFTGPICKNHVDKTGLIRR